MKKITPNKHQGKIIPNGVKPEPHEMDTILFFTGLSKDVELIPTSHTPGKKSPDFIINGIVWEAKNPAQNNRSALERIFYRASRQSSNLIFDLRRLKGNAHFAIGVIEKCFADTRRVRRMVIITKTSELKMYHKGS